LAIVSEGYKFTEGPATNSKGEVFFNDVPTARLTGLDLMKVSQFIVDSKKGSGQAFGPDGRLYAVATGEQKVIAYAADGTAKVIRRRFRRQRHRGGPITGTSTSPIRRRTMQRPKQGLAHQTEW